MDSTTPIDTAASQPADPSSIEHEKQQEQHHEEIDYAAWDTAIVEAIQALPNPQTRSQTFLTAHPDALTKFRHLIDAADPKGPSPPQTDNIFVLKLAPFQHHPTYLLRYMLAEWRDEDCKSYRKDLTIILQKAIIRMHNTQKWRNGQGECWTIWGYSSMEEMYTTYTTPTTQSSALQDWYFQAFYGTDHDGHPVHYDLLPNSYKEDLITPMIIRRLLNNENTLRSRIYKYNPPPPLATQEQLSNPRLGVTWIMDARNLTLWASPAMYKTMNALMQYSIAVTGAHYPEQGYRTWIISLGSVLMSLYNLAMKVMPAQTQRTTQCAADRSVLSQVVGEEEVPGLFKQKSQKGAYGGFSKEEKEKQIKDGNLGRWESEKV